MKQEDFFKIMDCASEDDIADMMRYHRSRQLPAREEKIMMTKHTQTDSGMFRSKGVAAAIAAVLVCANVAGGIYLLRGDNQPETKSETSAGTDIESELIPAVSENTPDYVKLMQEYYTNLSGQPCDYDFSGMGRNLDETVETDDVRIHIKGMVGCDWTMFVFFDAEPLNLSAKDREYFSSMAFCKVNDMYYPALGIVDAEGKADDSCQRLYGTMPGQQSLDNGVFHCYCIISNHSAEALTDGEKYLGIGKMNEPYDPEYDIRIPLDSLKKIPMQESELAAAVSAHIPDTMTRCAVTPFGVYCVSDTITSGDKNGGEQRCYWLDNPKCELEGTPAITQTGADGAVLSKIGLDSHTSWGAIIKEGTGVSFADFLFDRPFDVSKGILCIDEASENVQEIKEEPAETQQYVQLMQDYFTRLNGQQCSYDFTGMGVDINASYEDEYYTLTHRAVVGNDWFLYYFYDVTPKENYYSMFDGNSVFSGVHLRKGDEDVTGFCSRGGGGLLPGADLKKTEDGVFHLCWMYVNDSDEPLFHGENAGAQLVFPNYETGREIRVDFVPEEIPLREAASPTAEIDPLRDLSSDKLKESQHVLSLFRQRNAEHPLTRCADTPLGRIYFSDRFTADSSYLYQNSMDPDRCLQEAQFLSFDGISSTLTMSADFGDMDPDDFDDVQERCFILRIPYAVPGAVKAEDSAADTADAQ